MVWEQIIDFFFAIFRQQKGVWVGKSRIAPIDPKLIENLYYIKSWEILNQYANWIMYEHFGYP